MSQDSDASLPDFDPQGTERITSIPARFLVGGLLALRASGQWMYAGEEIEHPGVCAFLARQLRRTEEGRYWVVNGPQRVLVEIESTPFFVTMLDLDADTDTLTIRLNDKSEEPLQPTSLFRGPDEILYAHVKQGKAGAAPGSAHIAQFLRTAVMPLESLLVESEDDGVGLAIGGQVYAIPQRASTPVAGQAQ